MPVLRSFDAEAAIASDFFSAAVWCAFGLHEPFAPRGLPATGSYPGQQREVCFAGSFFAFPWPVELGLFECWSVHACPCAVLRPVLCTVEAEAFRCAELRVLAFVLRLVVLAFDAGLRPLLAELLTLEDVARWGVELILVVMSHKRTGVPPHVASHPQSVLAKP